MCLIGSGYLPELDKFNFIDFLVIQNHAQSTEIRIESEH